MLENINIFSSVAVYVQIENEVQFAIASGKLKPGDQLPSVRDASERLKVNPNTVAKAYRDLEVMGLLYTRRGMGVYINKGIQAACSERCGERIVDRIHEVVSEAKAAGLSKKDINDFAGKCFGAESGPYDEPPRSLLALARPKKGSK